MNFKGFNRFNDDKKKVVRGNGLKKALFSLALVGAILPISGCACENVSELEVNYEGKVPFWGVVDMPVAERVNIESDMISFKMDVSEFEELFNTNSDVISIPIDGGSINIDKEQLSEAKDKGYSEFNKPGLSGIVTLTLCGGVCVIVVVGFGLVSAYIEYRAFKKYKMLPEEEKEEAKTFRKFLKNY